MKDRVLLSQPFCTKENLLFWLVILLHLLPLFVYAPFPTLDGPAHLYNSGLIGELLSTSKGNLHTYFELNLEPNPNWLSHFFLSVAQLFFSAFTAHTLLISVYVIALPLSFRFFLVRLGSQNFLSHYLIFPFIYSFLFYCGFYNFCLGIVLLFFTAGKWIDSKDHPDFWKGLILSVLFLVLYFAHLGTFLFCGLMLGIFILFDRTRTLKSKSKSCLYLLIITAPSLLLASTYLVKSHSQGISYLSFAEHFYWLKTLRALIIFDFVKEKWFLLPLNFVFLFTFIYVLRNKIRRKEKIEPIAICTLLALLLFFIIPDSLSDAAGYLTDRFLLLFYLLFACWISVQYLSRTFTYLIFGISVATSGAVLINRHDQTQTLSENGNAFITAAGLIEKNSILLPLNLSDNFMDAHLSNYLGCYGEGVTGIVILENYEAEKDYFPVKWQKSVLQFLMLNGIPKKFSPDDVLLFEDKFHTKIDYISIWNPKKDSHVWNMFLETNYIEIPSGSEHLYLFKRKTPSQNSGQGLGG